MQKLNFFPYSFQQARTFLSRWLIHSTGTSFSYNHEGANIIITAGSKGFKFWDICDPFCPLWVNPFLGTTFGLDWLPDPRCVYGAMEDGTMWLLSLERAAHDIPLTVTGNYHNVASKHGFHSFHCSTFASFKGMDH
ncbi:uncharacterized protein LOC121767594 [Salvia splendens]|uniref:uncharacterized protein LOC121767594 n=1 Tax=Salvia splendens TaxID=180675 RepID=UPI001C279157|nr:uncharacterized protein LOC121767594 [Salvia splendens]XP_042019834.1 uncharacterized protein LOC121767594 [Salvia splendens]